MDEDRRSNSAEIKEDLLEDMLLPEQQGQSVSCAHACAQEAEESTAAGEDQPAMASWVDHALLPPVGRAVCKFCGFVVDPEEKGTRLVRKSPKEYKCKECNTKAVQLSKLLGSWPIEEFKLLSKQQQEHFWKEEAEGLDGVKASVRKHIVKRLIHTKPARSKAFSCLVVGRQRHATRNR